MTTSLPICDELEEKANSRVVKEMMFTIKESLKPHLMINMCLMGKSQRLVSG